MSDEPDTGHIFHLFAKLLDYPRCTTFSGMAQECATLVAERSPEAAELLHSFASFAAKTSLTRMEEIYTDVFELDATCHPYIGYHLFGESYKRSAFLLGLKDRYRPYHVQCGSELPDHLAVMLRFLAVNENPEEKETMIGEAIYPGLLRMLKNKEEEPPDPSAPKAPAKGGEYRGLLQALQAVLSTMVSLETLPAIPAPVDEFLTANPSLACRPA